MSYRVDKPYGRRKTDRPLSDQKRHHLQSIRRDVEEDPSGMIRRYLRLASKALDNGPAALDDGEPVEPTRLEAESWRNLAKRKAA